MDQPPSPPSDRLGLRVRELALTLTGWPSVNGTPDEAAFPSRLAALLRTQPYFQAHPDHLIVQPIAGDPYGRANVLAFVAGAGRRCVTLSGHFDTVPIDDYAELSPLATQPEALRPALMQKLAITGGYPLAEADLASGDYLPGRGLLDMKSGLAAGIAVLEEFAAAAERHGSLLLIATPDEEDRSAGMRAAADALPGVLRQFAVDAVLGINLDALIDNGDGSAGRIVAMGCVGKLLLSALVVGRDAHACYPLLGVNAAYLAAELLCELEYAPELAEESGTERASPPTALGSRDLKTVYNVTTPGRVWATWNVLTQRRSAAEVMRIAAQLAHAAASRAAERMAQRGARLRNAVVPASAWQDIPVLTFAELRQQARGGADGFDARFDAEAAALAGRADLDLPTRCRILTELAWNATGREGPAIILGFASLPYPAVHLDDPALEQRIRAVTAEVAARHNTTITPVQHLEVIVDMSFLGKVEAADLRHTAQNTPIWGSSIVWPLDPAPTPGIPVLNVGPWGRDYHHFLERVNQSYAFGVLPELVRELARMGLNAR